MRTIKFRGRMVHYDGWIYGSLLLSSDGMASIWPIESNKLGDIKDVGNCTVGQFTGLKDKNGVEVYEGDVVIFDRKNQVVKWNNLHVCWGLFIDDQMNDEIIADWIREDGKVPELWMSSDIEVIGNIHENPELL